MCTCYYITTFYDLLMMMNNYLSLIINCTSSITHQYIINKIFDIRTKIEHIMYKKGMLYVFIKEIYE